MAQHPTDEPTRGRHRTVHPGLRHPVVDRRRFLTYLVAGSTLTVAAKLGVDTLAPGSASAVPTPSLPQPADLQDLGDVLILAGRPTDALLFTVEVTEDGRVRAELPRMEVGQGLTTAVAMLVAEELDLPLDRVDMPLAPARPELLMNQLTGGSNSIRSVYGPVRAAAAAARARLCGAAADRWGVAAVGLRTEGGRVLAADGRSAGYGELTRLAASLPIDELVARPKSPSEFTLVGTPQPRVDARAMVTGAFTYTLDLDIPGATPTMVRRPPTINGTVEQVHNEDDVRAMPGVLDIAVIETGVAVLAETFGQALDAVTALDVSWGPGTVDDLSDAAIRDELRRATVPLVPPISLPDQLDFEFDWAPISHAPMETNSAVADVRGGKAEIWGGMKSPIVAQQQIAKELGLPPGKVVCHVVQAGGSFGRRLFWDGPLEAARISHATGRVVKLMWSRTDDMRHGRARPPAHHRFRATLGPDTVLRLEHHAAFVETDWTHGLGEILTATAAELPGGNLGFAQSVFTLTVKSPYNFGAVEQVLTEAPINMHTGAWRSVYSVSSRGCEEIVVDAVAAKLGKDPYEFRRAFLKIDAQRVVLDKVAEEGDWGRSMDDGFAQGIAFHEEYRSRTACLVEVDGRDPRAPRVTKAVIAGDYGLPINPRGLKAQLLGGLTDAISVTLRAGLHIDKGLPLEGSYSQFHYARQADSPADVQIFILPGESEPGGAGELGVPAAAGAIANAYARATGIAPRSFPINFPVDFEPFPR
ncbi:xanthine dehydrogenase family protein molybdopterin-binding subunit [Pseudonocardia xinjiangensis]|uniref:Molybdopterin-dependent oxidoreductase n=1 Tax=Pseudonocardia xinjiangensis TaxID=75289 RepID=A0ABX1RDD0_9PSEU|nr:molybdopterin cofactor-binding domain-containing protein [Pseudonocardia xinjiangensis]NMH78388.1 molybdopterin-dependent oxidoreductase [Pseudonocardia xinjiangensis]